MLIQLTDNANYINIIALYQQICSGEWNALTNRIFTLQTMKLKKKMESHGFT